jgi:hypothetical protein
VSPLDRGHRRVDGWLTPSAALLVRLHVGGVVREETADEDGRFAFGEVPAGLAHFTIEPACGATLSLARPMVTPAIGI